MTIELESVSIIEGDRRLVDGLTLDISTDSCYLVTGPHGSGKTALLRVLMGLSQPDGGRVRLLGDYKYTWLACGVVFQEDRLIGDLSAVENVTVVRKLTSAKAAREELEQLIAPDRADKPVKQLTSAECRAVCIVRALSVPADLLVMDEPFLYMNGEERKKALRYILDHKGSTPLVIASADPADLSAFKRIELG